MAHSDKLTIYLADLVHNYLGGGSYMFPLNIGFIAAYAKKHLGKQVHIELFKYPDKLMARMMEKHPDVLGLSNYTWNAHINTEISRWIKILNHGTLVIWGGPDINQTDESYKKFYIEKPFVDGYVINEGEVGFLNVLSRYLETDNNVSETRESEIEGCITTGHNGITQGKPLKRISDVNIIPSPYLEGILDSFFQNDLIPIIETSRGCPYKCTYCAQGLVSQHKVKFFDTERVKEELVYIATHVNKTNILAFADANFGIAKRDMAIAEHIKELQSERNYPRRCIINWIKTPKSITLADTMGEASYLISSLQSTDPVVLHNIKRKNIDDSNFLGIIKETNKRGGISGTEIILALPGETKESHLNSLRKLFNWNVGYIICYNCLLINGSELTLPEQREKYRLQTKFRLIDSAFGEYGSIKSLECEEGIRSTSDMSEDEILYFRPIHWLIQFFWNYRFYFDLLKFVHQKEVNPVDFIVSVIDNSRKADVRVKKVIEEFMREAREEWFNTPEQLRDYYSRPENWERLRNGEVGKLNGKYIWKVILECKEAFDEVVRKTALELLSEFSTEINDIIKYTRHSYIALNEVGVKSDNSIQFEHDILSWKRGSYRSNLIKRENTVRFYLSDEKKKSLETLFQQYHHKNPNVMLRKMSEHMRLTDLFHNEEYIVTGKYDSYAITNN